ncbi:hypothetical protein GCM10027290_30460 [Micromonospora sonneratiae]
MFVLTRRAIGAGAGAQLDAAFVEVLLELAPFSATGVAVLGGRSVVAPLLKALLVVAHHVVVEDGD